MKKRAIVIIPDGFEEMEFCCPFDILSRGGIGVAIAGYGNIDLTGAHGLRVRADVMFADVLSEVFDCVILPGGPGCYSMRGDESVKTFLLEHWQAKKLLCAICAAPLILHDCGILREKKYTAHPCTCDELKGAQAMGRVVTDGNLLTASGPGAAVEFGLKILECLADGAIAGGVAKSALL
ncbi:MAG: DJ-1/PfpI family protein [Puniceicoccales bacterium]|jgi:4-methyl-5(b-hydroxyethyl)-thiazole monophosphate biosynthesis|nr:DJ-1/PfpI family protein [Puniceicoccales bacterium]